MEEFMKKNLLLITALLAGNNALFCMEKPELGLASKSTTDQNTELVRPIILTLEERVPAAISCRLALGQAHFNALIGAANQGNAQLQYLLGSYYLNGLTPTRTRDLEQAEQWFLKARTNDYLPAYSILVDVAMDQNNIEKWIKYGQEAVQRGFLDQNYNVGIAYKHQKKHKKSQECFEKTIKSLEPYQNDPLFKWIRDASLVELANLLRRDSWALPIPKKPWIYSKD